MIGIGLDKNGWDTVQDIIKKSAAYGYKFTVGALEEVVNNNDKNRFVFSDDKRKIRASQGHSIIIEPGYEPLEPPVVLYHGTATRFIESILKTGLEKRARTLVHLSREKETATKVGARHGKPVILEVAAGKMHGSGHVFYLSQNGVWLTDAVPVEFLTVIF